MLISAAVGCCLPSIANTACLANATGEFAPLEQLAFAQPNHALPKIDQQIGKINARTAKLNSNDRRELAQLYALKAEALRQMSEGEAALQASHNGVNILGSEQSSDLAIRLRSMNAQLRVDSGSSDAMAEFDQLIATVKPGSVAEACLKRDRSWSEFDEDDASSIPRAIEDMQFAYQQLGVFGARSEQMIAAGRLSRMFNAVGQYQRALTLVRESADYFVSEKAYVRATTAFDREFVIHYQMKNLAGALEAIRKLREVGVLGEDAFGLLVADCRECFVLARLGDLSLATAACKRAREVLAQDRGKYFDADYLQRVELSDAVIDMRAERVAEALQLLSTMQKRAPNALNASELAEYYDLLSNASARAGLHQQALLALRERQLVSEQATQNAEKMRIAGFIAQLDVSEVKSTNAKLQRQVERLQARAVLDRRLLVGAVGLLILVLAAWLWLRLGGR
jgi:tetratricopeptide (TPR) repeat protein